jgi:glucose/arabinose dehydrogenase
MRAPGLAMIAVLALVVAPTGSPSAAPRASAPDAQIVAEPVVTGLAFPAAFTVTPDGRFVYGQRLTGQIRVYDPGTGSDVLLYQVTHLVTDGEQGLLGLALDPGYPSRPFVYAYATRETQGERHNQILRVTEGGEVARGTTVVWTSNTAAGAIHNGGRILFGPDGMLYAFQGTPHPKGAQNLAEAGKILRMDREGAPPADNPFPGSRIWSYGHRNSFGFTFDPATGAIWQTENGPECNDEINRVVKGSNYGWGGSQTCSTPPPPPINTNQDGPSPVLPVMFYEQTIAVTGTAFCSGCGLSGSEGTLFWADFKLGQIHRGVLTADRTGIASQQVVFVDGGKVMSMERGPDGSLYFTDEVDGVGGIYKLVDR